MRFDAGAERACRSDAEHGPHATVAGVSAFRGAMRAEQEGIVHHSHPIVGFRTPHLNGNRAVWSFGTFPVMHVPQVIVAVTVQTRRRCHRGGPVRQAEPEIHRYRGDVPELEPPVLLQAVRSVPNAIHMGNPVTISRLCRALTSTTGWRRA